MEHDFAFLTPPQSSSSSSLGDRLAPGFRFHPTDEELVSYYLKRKVCGKGFRIDAISEVDVYKTEPWDLPGKSKLKSRDLEWYFFSGLDKKYGNGARTNRATEKGYWKTTGKDRAVSRKSYIVGMKKTLVYHHGRAPRGQRTNWVMHEYKLMDESLARAGIFQDAFVLCRIFQKSGPGPKNGEKYGAPLVEEEWEEDDLVLAPGKEVTEEAVDDNDIYLDSNDIQQIFDGKFPVEDVLPLRRSSFNNGQVQQTQVEEMCHIQDPKNQQVSVTEMQHQTGLKPANHEFVGDSSNSVNDLDFLLDDPFFDAIPDGPFDDLSFLETDDLLKVDPSGVEMFNEYINFYSTNQDNNPQYMSFDSSNMVGSENLFGDQSLFAPELTNGEAKQEIMGSQQLICKDDDAFESKQTHECVESGGKYSYIKKASHMLGGVSAPPALASEFPTKESALRLASSVHLTAGMIQIQKPKSNVTETCFIFSLGLSTSTVSRNMMYMIFFWVLVLSVTYNVGICFCSGNILS